MKEDRALLRIAFSPSAADEFGERARLQGFGKVLSGHGPRRNEEGAEKRGEEQGAEAEGTVHRKTAHQCEAGKVGGRSERRRFFALGCGRSHPSVIEGRATFQTG